MQALITGGSSGIGRALAHEFSKRGISVILIGRNVEALAQVEKECRQMGSNQTLSFSHDLEDPSGPGQIFAAVAERGIGVDILVNNAGAGAFGPFAGSNVDPQIALVRVQIEAMMRMTRLFLNQRPDRGRTRILNVGSVYSYAPVPMQATYGAAKSFLLSFSEALAFELRESNTTVTVLCPGSTRTSFRRRMGLVDPHKQHGERDLLGMEPEEVAQAGYKAMMRGQFVCIPGRHNFIFTSIVRHLPHFFRAKLIQAINRRRGLRPATPGEP